ncbi:MAG: hypothetical protein WD696_01305 [Bryobacteraceae bacterium]
MLSSVRALLAGVLDYAGLFPPAGLEMADAVANYAEYRGHEHAWMLGRFVAPIHRLDELAETGFPLTAIAGHNLASHAGQLFTRGVHAVEIKVSSETEIHEAREIVPPGLEVYFEIPVMASLVPSVVEARGRAKIRTGGLTHGCFPAAGDLARFIAACAAARLPFKATAGLHHALRSVHPITADPGGPSGWMYGFLNVFLAAAFVHHGMPVEDALSVLEETSPEAFVFDEEGVTWEGWRLTAPQLSETRCQFALSFGSCSFEEPVADLRKLGLL